MATCRHGDGAQIKGITYVFEVARKAIAATRLAVLLLAIWGISFGEIQSGYYFDGLIYSYQNSAGLPRRCGKPAGLTGILWLIFGALLSN